MEPAGNWPKVALGDVLASVKPGFASGKRSEDGVIQFRMNNVDRSGKVSWSTLTRVPADEKKLAAYGLKAGDVLFNQTNSRDLVGKTAYFNGLPEPVVFSNHFLRLRPHPDKLNGGYLARCLQSLYLTGFFGTKCNAWVNQATYGKDDLLSLPIPLPPLVEQRRIAAILDKADAIRRKRQQALSESAILEQSVFLGAVGPQAKDYRDWEPVSFEELAKPGKGTMRTGPFGSDLRHSEFVDEGVAVLGIDNAVQNRFAWAGRRFITQEKYEKLTRYTVFPGDVIVTIMGTTGRSAVVPDDIPLAITTKHLATITPDRAKVEPEFLSNALHRHPAVLSQIKMANKGAIMDGLNLGIIKGLRVPLPPIEVQRQYVADLGHIRAVQAKMHQDYLEAETLFASLSQRAFRGDLSPTSIPA